MDPVEAAVDVAGNLVPPELKKLKPETKWKLWVAGGLFMTAAGLSTHIAIACGFLGFISPGFAKEGEAEKVKTELTAQMVAMESRVSAKSDQLADIVNKARVNTLRKDLFDSRQKQCKAPTGTVRTMLTNQLKDMQDEYELLTGKKYDLPTCDSF